MFKLDAGAKTDIGLKRQRNEDAFVIRLPGGDTTEDEPNAFFVVADGMGGMGGGDVASRAAIAELLRTFYHDSTASVALLARLDTALEATNVYVRSQASTVGLPRIGTTIAGVLLTPREAIIFNVGDSRVYRVRAGHIEQLSYDHSVDESQDERAAVETRSARNANLTAFLGQARPIKPYYQCEAAQAGDIFIICSDGLWDLVTPAEICRLVTRSTAQRAANRLIRLVRQRGAPDNVTAVVVGLAHPPRRRRFLLLLALLLLVILVSGLTFLILNSGPNLSVEVFGQPPSPAHQSPGATADR